MSNIYTMTRHVCVCGHMFVMPMMLSIISLHAVGYNDHNEVEQDIFSHMMPLVPVFLSCDSSCIINGTMFFSLHEGNVCKVSHDFQSIAHVML